MGLLINWRVRFRNRNWVIAFISQMFIVAQVVLAGLNSMGITDFQISEALEDWVITMANAVFVLLSMLGIVQDPTTKGFGDSERAKQYKVPD
jgi:phi LC3 family holin